MAREPNARDARRVTPVDLHACLADPIRFRMVHLLLAGPLCVKHFQAILDISQVTASKQLGVLKRRGMVEVRRHGTLRVYSLPEPRDLVLAAVLRGVSDCAVADPTCQSDLKRREDLSERIQGEVTGRLSAVRPRRATESPPPATPDVPPGAWPTASAEAFLD
jgi:DNA-binding transcriptional ArsR family regulator